MGAGKHTRSALPETEGFGSPAANKRQTGSSQSHLKVTVSSGRPPSPAFSLLFPVWSKASRIEKALGWELPALIPIHSTFQRESGLGREHQCSNSAPGTACSEPWRCCTHPQLPELGTVSQYRRSQTLRNQSKEIKASDKLVLII